MSVKIKSYFCIVFKNEVMGRCQNRRGNVEIYKDYSPLLTEDNYDDLEDNHITDEEIRTIESVCKIKAINNDTGNEYTAFDLDCDADTADKLVDTLNELAESMGEEGLWYFGDEQDEYVYVY
jgi:hypothetical protein